MKLGYTLARLALASLPLECAARALSGKPSDFIIPEKRAPLQDIVRTLLSHQLISDSYDR